MTLLRALIARLVDAALANDRAVAGLGTHHPLDREREREVLHLWTCSTFHPLSGAAQLRIPYPCRGGSGGPI